MNKIYQLINSNLKRDLYRVIPNHSIREIYEYAVFPPGKLFRPLLVANLALDLDNNFNENQQLFASAIELHHAYTLAHDDLPAMDNDSTRRGKPSTHIAFGEWQALLVGDGLLNASYQLLSKINCKNFQDLFSFFSWALGAKGLIHGQTLDLMAQGKPATFCDVVDVHVLKTSRLIQAALIGSSLLSSQKISFRKRIDLMRLGYHLGLAFQLLDDLSELTASTDSIGEHEGEINPFIHFKDEATDQLIHSVEITKNVLTNYKLVNLNKLISSYYLKNKNNIEQHQKIYSKIKIDLEKIINIFDAFKTEIL